MNIQNMKAKHKLIKEYSYQPGQIERGYNNRTLYINLSDNTIKEKPVTEQMKEKFIGGKGFGLRLLWDGTKPETKWNDPENENRDFAWPDCRHHTILRSGKSLVVTISPTTESIMDSNVGGHFGPYMKFSGFDALELQGKANSNNIIILIDGVKQYHQHHRSAGRTSG